MRTYVDCNCTHALYALLNQPIYMLMHKNRYVNRYG